MHKIMVVIIPLIFPALPTYAENPVKEAGKETGQAFKEGSKETGQAARKTGRSMGEWFRDMGRSFKNFFSR